MTAIRRLQKEALELEKNGVAGFVQLKVNESDVLIWEGLVVPVKVPYDKGAFRVTITFPATYPFKPPSISFKTRIYHPNIDEKGQVCLAIINSENWRPATKMEQVLDALVKMVNDPEPDHPLRTDLAEEFIHRRKQFNKMAENITKRYGERRPEKR